MVLGGAAAAVVVLGGAPPGPSPGQHAPPRLSQDYMAWVLASVVDLETDGGCGGVRRVFLAGEDEASRAALLPAGRRAAVNAAPCRGAAGP